MLGPAASTNIDGLDDEGSGALEVLWTLGLRLLVSSIHEGSTYSSSSDAPVMLMDAVMGCVACAGMSVAAGLWLEKRKVESVAWTS
jgi:hypothetical protein